MSLRWFHLVFIALSVVLAAFSAAWSVGIYRAAHQGVYVAGAVLSLAGGIGLSCYGAAFQRKMRRIL